MIPTTAQKENALIHELEFIGKTYGYGHAMAILSGLWRKECKDNGIPEEIAFTETIIDFVKPEEREHIRASMRLYDRVIKEALGTSEVADDTFPCDPSKAKNCKQTNCYLNGGPCRRTTLKEQSK